MDLLTTHPIQTGWEISIEPYPCGRFGSIDNPDRQFGNSSVPTQTKTRSDGPEPLLQLAETLRPNQRSFAITKSGFQKFELALQRSIIRQLQYFEVIQNCPLGLFGD